MAGVAGFSPALTIDIYTPIWHAMNDSNIHEQFWRLPAYRWLNRVFLAESRGFEPLERLRALLFSRQAQLATLPTLRVYSS